MWQGSVEHLPHVRRDKDGSSEQRYQRGSRRSPRPPPPPPPNPRPPPPPPPPPNCGFGRASLMARVRPPSCVPFNSVTAFWASASEAISTNAKPRARPVALSRITLTVSTPPARLNSSRSSSSFVEYGRLPTYSLRPISCAPCARTLAGPPQQPGGCPG